METVATNLTLDCPYEDYFVQPFVAGFIEEHPDLGDQLTKRLMKRGLSTDLELLNMGDQYSLDDVDTSPMGQKIRGAFGPHMHGQFYGISIAFDNINRNIMRKEYSSKSQTKVINMTSLIAFFNRIPIHGGDLMMKQQLKHASDLPYSTWLMTEDDVTILRSDHFNEIRRILQAYLKVFENSSVEHHTPHAYKQLSSKKTEMVS